MSSVPLRQIEYLSPASQVSMGDHWFEIAHLSHFWIERRFEVLQRLVGASSWQGLAAAEIGCGSGLLQRQCEDAFGIEVDGFDLNHTALGRNIARRSRVICYDVFDRLPELRERYDVIFLFDVIEHIADHAAFIEATVFHLKPGGRLIINVPAHQALFSEYDRAAGHVRRYHPRDLQALLQATGVQSESWTYWGFWMVPLLALRQWFLRGQTKAEEILRKGFQPASPLINALLRGISRVERIPQHLNGSSLMLISRKPPAGAASSEQSPSR